MFAKIKNTKNKIEIGLIIICGLFTSKYIYNIYKWLFYKNQIDYGEGLVVACNKMWMEGTWKWVHTVDQHMPLMYGVVTPILNTSLMKIFGAELWTCRIIMVIATMVCCIVVFIIVKQVSKNVLYALIAGLLPITQPIIRDWSLMARVDNLSVMFDILGLITAWFFIKNIIEEKETKKTFILIFISALIFVIGIFTKITAIGGLIAIDLWLLIYSKKNWFWFTGLVSSLFMATFSYWMIVSNGEYINHVITNNITKDKVWELAILLPTYTIVFIPMCVIITLAFVYCIKNYKNKNSNIYVFWFIATFVISMVSGIRPGSFINYYIELVFASSALTGLIIKNIIDKARYEFNTNKKANFEFGIICAMIAIMEMVCIKNAFPFPNEQYDYDVNIATELIKDADGLVISENAGILVNSNRMVFTDFFIYTNQCLMGWIDDSEYIEKFKNGEVDYVIMRMPTYKRPPEGDYHFRKEVKAAIQENFELIYEPKENFYWYGINVYESKKKIMENGGVNRIVMLNKN